MFLGTENVFPSVATSELMAVKISQHFIDDLHLSIAPLNDWLRRLHHQIAVACRKASDFEHSFSVMNAGSRSEDR